MLGEFTGRPAVNLKHSIGFAVALQNDVDRAADAVLLKHFWGSKPFLIFQMVGNDCFPGLERETRR